MSLISDISTYLQSNGIGTVGTNIFYSYMPADVGACVVILDTGGSQPDTYLPTKEPTFQIYLQNIDYDTGKIKLEAIRELLHQKTNITIGSTYFYFILAVSEGGHLGRNADGLDEFSMNFHCRIR